MSVIIKRAKILCYGCVEDFCFFERVRGLHPSQRLIAFAKRNSFIEIWSMTRFKLWKKVSINKRISKGVVLTKIDCVIEKGETKYIVCGGD